ncbi:unannotated protein [freshwater metagenome]|uniref:Unannotated protein n=1 Tax=freshwater metagenome TaxID=449393 RepID=A0A6J7CPM4_9ZZZZ|nr:hypothetical protein [Actinomycetota bacterium]
MSTPPRWDPDAPRHEAPRQRERSRSSRARSGWAELFGEQRLAAAASAGLIVTMFLPWYTQTPVGISGNSRTLMAFQSWGFVEASILLVAVAILGLVWARANRRAFHLPFGDGIVLMGAGAWVMFLVFYRQIDHPNGGPNVAVGVSWGIFLAFICGALITYAGWRLKATHRPEPIIDGDDPRTTIVERTALDQRPATAPARRSRRQDGQFEGQMSFDEPDDPQP